MKGKEKEKGKGKEKEKEKGKGKGKAYLHKFIVIYVYCVHSTTKKIKKHLFLDISSLFVSWSGDQPHHYRW